MPQHIAEDTLLTTNLTIGDNTPLYFDTAKNVSMEYGASSLFINNTTNGIWVQANNIQLMDTTGGNTADIGISDSNGAFFFGADIGDYNLWSQITGTKELHFESHGLSADATPVPIESHFYLKPEGICLPDLTKLYIDTNKTNYISSSSGGYHLSIIAPDVFISSSEINSTGGIDITPGYYEMWCVNPDDITQGVDVSFSFDGGGGYYNSITRSGADINLESGRMLGLKTSNNGAGNSGDITIQTGTASGTRGSTTVDSLNITQIGSGTIKLQNDLTTPTRGVLIQSSNLQVYYKNTAGAGTNFTLGSALSEFYTIAPTAGGNSPMMYFRTGNCPTTGNSGQLKVYTGTSDVQTGYIDIYSGNMSAGAGTATGIVSLHSGSSAVASGTVSIYSGSANTGNSGDVSIYTGTSTSGTRGSVSLNGLNIILNSFSGILKATSGTVSTITDSSSNWDAAYSHSIATSGTIHGLTWGNVVTSVTPTNISASIGTNTLTISIPQSVATSASPTFVALTIGDGTESAPAYTFTSDTNTGVYRTGSDAIGLTLGGTDCLLLTNTASAVNEITITNSATGTYPTISATGDNTNIGLNINSKGAADINVNCGTQKTVVLTQTVWDDLTIPGMAVGTGTSSPDPITFGPSGNLIVYGFNGAGTTPIEQVYFQVQMPHSWKEGTNIKPHIHWTPTTTGAGDVKWQLEYYWANINGTYGAPTTISGVATASGTAWQHQIDSLTDISGSGKTISSILVCRLFRDPGDAADTYTGDAAFISFDFHYEKDTWGSRQTTVK